MTAKLAFTLTLSLLAACSGSCGGSQRLPTSDRTATPLRVTIDNATDHTVYLASDDDCQFGPLSASQAGRPLILYAGQSLSCDEVKQGPCPSVGGCAGPGVRPLRAGEQWTVEWDGLHYVETSVEAGEAAQGCPTSCVVELPAEAGPLVLAVRGFSGCGGAECACETSELSETCQPSGLPAEPDLRAEATVGIPERGGQPVSARLRFE